MKMEIAEKEPGAEGIGGAELMCPLGMVLTDVHPEACGDRRFQLTGTCFKVAGNSDAASVDSRTEWRGPTPLCVGTSEWDMGELACRAGEYLSGFQRVDRGGCVRMSMACTMPTTCRYPLALLSGWDDIVTNCTSYGLVGLQPFAMAPLEAPTRRDISLSFDREGWGECAYGAMVGIERSVRRAGADREHSAVDGAPFALCGHVRPCVTRGSAAQPRRSAKPRAPPGSRRTMPGPHVQGHPRNKAEGSTRTVSTRR